MAYKTLKDPEKRRSYDQFGMDGLSRCAAQTTQVFHPDELLRAYFKVHRTFDGCELCSEQRVHFKAKLLANTISNCYGYTPSSLCLHIPGP